MVVHQSLVREKGRTDGAANGTYYAAYVTSCLHLIAYLTGLSTYRYVYFEKVRILENKKKSAKRLEAESMHPNGFLRENRRYLWVLSS